METTSHAVRPSSGSRLAALLDRLWHGSPPLTVVGVLMVIVAGASVVGLLVDPRVITGAPAWLKPFKFAVSTGIYSLTLAWIFGWLSDWPRVRRTVGWVTAIVFVLEVAIIDVQAWRGTTSHFNVSTRLDMALFSVMGTAIVLQTGGGQRLGRDRPVAAALHRRHARLGPAPGHDAHHRRRVHRGADDPPDRRAARGRARWRPDVGGRRPHRGRSGRRSRPAAHRVEPRARRCACASLRRPARDPGARAHCRGAATVAPAGGRARQGVRPSPPPAMRRCFFCCCGERCADRVSRRRMPRSWS